MSPVVDGRVVLDKDGFLRNERGQKSMPHLTAGIAAALGVVLALAGLAGYVITHDGWIHILQIGGGLVASAAGLEGWQTTIESRNQRGPQ